MLAIANSPKVLWYLTRGSGIVVLLLLTIVVVLGIVTSMDWKPLGIPQFVSQAIHRSISLGLLIFLVTHVATTVIDGYVPVGWLDVIVPFHSAYKSLWTGLGALAVDCLLVIIVTSLLKARIRPRLWRAIHWSVYLCWPVAMIHAFGIGSDSRQTWMLALYGAQLLVVLGLIGLRVNSRRSANAIVYLPDEIRRRAR